MDTAPIYLMKHEISSSEAQITCGVDQNNKVRVASTKMISGKVIPLHSVRTALQHFAQEYELNEEPDQIA
jgi:hypothetical protein